MSFDVVTLFPEMFTGPLTQSMVKRAQDKKLVEIRLRDLRQWAVDARGSVDDRPYGGGVGMILRVEPVFHALQDIKSAQSVNLKSRTVLLDARGKQFTQKMAQGFSELDNLVLICGHYEGVDERIKEYLVDEAISVGPYVLTGGELPAMTIMDSVTRLVPGVLEKPEATKFESFSEELENELEYPQYTRPEEFNGWKVPNVLLSGNHEEIKKWRKNKN